MTEYIIIFGNHPLLSLAELRAVLAAHHPQASLNYRGSTVAHVSTPAALDVAALMQRLGGTIKVTEVITTTTIKDIAAQRLAEVLQPLHNQETKFHFGISTYPVSPTSWRPAKNIGLEVKKGLKVAGISSRLVSSRDAQLSSVTVAKNRLLKNGAELCLFVDGDAVTIARTVAVQPFGEFSRRDYGRPGRDSLSGMLPPKLARMMINISGAEPTATLLDPFCGSGTILTEAGLLRFTNTIGSDISDKAITDTAQNADFSAVAMPQLRVADVTRLSDWLAPDSIDVIVTEPYLGQPLRGSESATVIEKSKRELQQLYKQAFTQFDTVLKASGTVVVVLPVLQGQPTADQPFLQWVAQHTSLQLRWPLTDLVPAPQPPLMRYKREGQKVERDIGVFKKQ